MFPFLMFHTIFRALPFLDLEVCTKTVVLDAPDVGGRLSART